MAAGNFKEKHELIHDQAGQSLQSDEVKSGSSPDLLREDQFLGSDEEGLESWDYDEENAKREKEEDKMKKEEEDMQERKKKTEERVKARNAFEKDQKRNYNLQSIFISN